MHRLKLFSLLYFLSIILFLPLEGKPFLNFNKSDEIDLFEFHRPIDFEETSTPSSSGALNLEKKAQDFILEMKEIRIPGHAHSFNPSITRWKGNLLMAFRIRDPKKLHLTNQIGFVWLDENFDLISPPYILHIPKNGFDLFAKEQDPRLITIEDRLYMVYSNLMMGSHGSEVRRMFLTEIHFDGIHFFSDPPECLSSFENDREQRWEKNWVPFEYEGNLLLAYSLTPHRILSLLGNGKCKTVASTLGSIRWEWGVLRGGTPAILDGDHYLSFFHSSIKMESAHSNGKTMPHYVMGAYTFSSKPPFEITHISPEPIIGNNFYTSPPYKTWKPLRVVFPCGLLISEDYVWVFYGKQDFEIWVVKIDKKKLLNSLVPVTTILGVP